MIDRTHELPITSQVRILGFARSTAYYQPEEPAPEVVELMHRIDSLHTQMPWAGSRMIRDALRNEGMQIGRKRVKTLMRKMNIRARYQAPRTTQRNPNHKIFPYLLRNRIIGQANDVWAMDITYIPMARGFSYLVAVLDWATRKILSWSLSNSMSARFCVDAFQDAVSRFGAPAIVNTDQGSQFTSKVFVEAVQDAGCDLSMDGKGAWRDNIFIERFWRSLKYEHVYLYAYENLRDGRKRLQEYISQYNQIRPHQAHQGRPPDAAYFDRLPHKVAA